MFNRERQFFVVKSLKCDTIEIYSIKYYLKIGNFYYNATIYFTPIIDVCLTLLNISFSTNYETSIKKSNNLKLKPIWNLLSLPFSNNSILIQSNFNFYLQYHSNRLYLKIIFFIYFDMAHEAIKVLKSFNLIWLEIFNWKLIHWTKRMRRGLIEIQIKKSFFSKMLNNYYNSSCKIFWWKWFSIMDRKILE